MLYGCFSVAIEIMKVCYTICIENGASSRPHQSAILTTGIRDRVEEHVEAYHREAALEVG